MSLHSMLWLSKNINSQIKYFVEVTLAVMLLPPAAPHKQSYVNKLKEMTGISLVISASWANIYKNRAIFQLKPSQSLWVSDISLVLSAIKHLFVLIHIYDNFKKSKQNKKQPNQRARRVLFTHKSVPGKQVYRVEVPPVTAYNIIISLSF